jgi:hypothetical protein
VAVETRFDRFRGLGPFLAFATSALFGLGVIVLIGATVVATQIAQANNEELNLLSLPVVWPPWYVPVVDVGGVLLVLSAVSGYAVALDLELIVQSATTSIKAHCALVAATVSLVAFVAIVTENVFLSTPNTPAYGVEFVAFISGIGVYLLLMNAAARRPDLLGSSLTVIGMIAGGLFLAALVVALGGLLGALLLLAPALLLFLVWSVWLALRMRSNAGAFAATNPRDETTQ